MKPSSYLLYESLCLSDSVWILFESMYDGVKLQEVVLHDPAKWVIWVDLFIHHKHRLWKELGSPANHSIWPRDKSQTKNKVNYKLKMRSPVSSKINMASFLLNRYSTKNIRKLLEKQKNIENRICCRWDSNLHLWNEHQGSMGANCCTMLNSHPHHCVSI